MHCRSPAKINLFLKVLSKRDDGYHTIASVVQLIDLYDEVEIVPSRSFHLSVEGDDSVPKGDDNLVVRAFQLFAKHTRIRQQVAISLRKRIPAGAGLGGGSSNAATVLLALNRLWRTRLSVQQLAALGSQLGADVPFFIYGGNALIEGIGDIVSRVHIVPSWYIVCLTGQICSTASVFSSYSVSSSNRQLTSVSEWVGLPAPDQTRSYQAERLTHLGNDLQAVVLAHYPTLCQVYQILSGYCPVSMSGSGSSFFACVQHQHTAKELQDCLKRVVFGCRFVIVRGISRNDWDYVGV